MELHARTEEILARTDYYCHAAVRTSCCVWRQQCGGTFHIHAILKNEKSITVK